MKLRRLFTTALTVSLAISPLQAVALSSTEYALMVVDFERTYGKNYVPLGAQHTSNRCILPPQSLKQLNASLYDQQIKERLVCEGEMHRLVDTIRKDSQWSPAMDEALTVLGNTYHFIPAIQLREQRRNSQVDIWRQQRWSVAMERALGDLSKDHASAKTVLDQARRINRLRVESAPWSSTVEAVLSPMTPFDTAAINLLRSKRQAYLSPWTARSWSPLMETTLAPMIDEFAIPEAIALRERKRRDLVKQWVNQPYSAEMEQALSELAAIYPPAQTLLKEKKPSPSPSSQSSSSSQPHETSTLPKPTPEPSPASGSSLSKNGIIATIIIPIILAVLGGGFYLAWFGI